MTKLAFFIFLAGSLSASAQVATNINPICAERTYQDSTELFLEAYNSSKILGWGLTSHYKPKPLEELSQFLDQIGHDENLKYVFTEMPSGLAADFVKISNGTKDDMTAILKSFSDYKYGMQPLLENFQFGQEIKYLYSKVVELNQRRKNKILIVPINLTNDLRTGRTLVPILSWNREDSTKDLFMEYYRQMSADEKAIIVFHTYHLARAVEGSLTKYQNGSDMFDRMVTSPVGFMGMAPFDEKTFKMIVFDLVADGSSLFKYNSTATPVSFKVSGLASAEACLSSGNFYEQYVSNGLQYPEHLASAFQYVVFQ